MAKQTILKATDMLFHWHDIKEIANDFICGEYLLPCFFWGCNLICIFTNFARFSGSFSSAFSSAFSSLLFYLLKLC